MKPSTETALCIATVLITSPRCSEGLTLLMSCCSLTLTAGSAGSRVLHLVTKVQSAGRLERPDRLEFDVAGPESVEEPSSLAEQDRDQLDLQHVQHARPQAFPCRVGT